MAIVTIIEARNVTASPLAVENLNLPPLAVGVNTLLANRVDPSAPNRIVELQANQQLLDRVIAGDVVIRDGGTLTDLTVGEATNALDSIANTTPGAGGGGDVVGPGASTDDALVRWDGVTGMLVADSVVILSDAGVMTGPGPFQIIGGTAASDELQLRGTSDANLGLIRAQSPIVFDDVTAAVALSPFSISDTSSQTLTALYIGGTMRASPIITFSNPIFVWSAVTASPDITSLVSPTLAAFTLFFGAPLLRAGAAVGFDPLQAQILFAAPVTINDFAGSKTSPQTIAVSFSPQTRTTLAGAILTVTNQTGLNVAPVFSTVAGSTANLGNIRGVWMRNPALGFLQPGAGFETLTSLIGLDVDAIPFGGNVTKAALRSFLTPASATFFLLNPGGAQSDFGGGFVNNTGLVQVVSNTLGLSLGSPAARVQLLWNGTALEWDPIVGDELRWEPTASNYWSLDSDAASQGLRINLQTIVFGTTAADPSSINGFVQFAAPNLRSPTANGDYADVLWTAGGSIDMAGFSGTNVGAFTINTPAYVLSGGSIDDAHNLFVNAMTSEGIATRTQALRVLGRSRLDGLINHKSSSPAQIVADQNDYALPPNNLGRFMLRLSTDASRTITGIAVTQTGDSLIIVNVGSFDLVLAHQDVLSAASNRIISPTGADLTLGPGESAYLWHDDGGTDRWRILGLKG